MSTIQEVSTALSEMVGTSLELDGDDRVTLQTCPTCGGLAALWIQRASGESETYFYPTIGDWNECRCGA